MSQLCRNLQCLTAYPSHAHLGNIYNNLQMLSPPSLYRFSLTQHTWTFNDPCCLCHLATPPLLPSRHPQKHKCHIYLCFCYRACPFSCIIYCTVHTIPKHGLPLRLGGCRQSLTCVDVCWGCENAINYDSIVVYLPNLHCIVVSINAVPTMRWYNISNKTHCIIRQLNCVCEL